jgi:PAS domain S-box-containing protein
MINLNGRQNGITTLIDITNRKRAERELRKAREDLERRVLERTAALSETNKKLAEQAFMLANISDAVIGFDLDYRITYFSKSAEKIYGYSTKEVIGRPSIEIFKPSYLGMTREDALLQLANTGQLYCEAIHSTKDGRSIIVETHAGLLYSDQGQPIGIVGVNHDITGRKRMYEEKEKLEEELRQAQKMEAIGTLAGGIAHDFNNMLAAILGNSELALDDLEGADGPRHYIEQIIKASKRARDLVKQILAFSRKTEQGKDIIDLVSLVKETSILLRGTVPSTIQMDLRIQTEKDTIMADPSQVQQVIMNLATNAYHAMRDEGGTLTISISDVVLKKETLPDPDMQPGIHLKLTIADTGPGIKKEILHRIFEPFFTTKESGQGTGMGLAVVYGIVKGHGGAITVDSIAGKGSTFTIFLPYVDSRGKKEEDDQASVPGGGERILLVDDEPSVMQSVSIMLRRLGYRVTSASAAAEALKIFQKDSNGFDLIITDQMMPDVTGLDLAKCILEMREDIPIILFTGYGEMIRTEKIKEAGISELLVKPVTKGEMAETVRKVLASRNSANTP